MWWRFNVWLTHRLTVDGNLSVAYLHHVPGEADDSLDKVTAWIVWVTKNNDVAALRAVKEKYSVSIVGLTHTGHKCVNQTGAKRPVYGFVDEQELLVV